MKLITEITEDVQYVTEETKGGRKNLYIEGIFLQSSVKNRNGRVYPEEVMDKEVSRYIQESVQKNTAMGELGHPDGPKINLDRVSHRIVSLTKEGTNYRGKALITNTPMGETARGLIESGVKLGVSSRGMGTLKTNSKGINEVQKDFRLATAADIVADPSAPDAWVNGIMENVEWTWHEKAGWQMVPIVSEAKRAIEEAVRQRVLEDKKVSLFAKYLERLSKV